ncbi:MAG: ABC transporter permease, partial [Eubacterium sp.]|nr:ABC transporter permease [Eubacterium sp.]
KEDALGMVGTFILMPMSLFSGVLFPFKFMPDAMQKIGSCFPQRWIALAIEKMQLSGSMTSGWKETLMVLILSAILFTMGIVLEGKTGKPRAVKAK